MQIKRMNWFQKRPLHKYMEAWRNNRRAMIAEMQDASAFAASRFTSAQVNLAAGTAQLAITTSAERAQSEMKAKIASFVDKLA